MTVFYHISTNLNHNGVFYPRIPSCRHEHEDSVTKRISVGNSIGDCLTAIPNGGMRLEDTNEERRGYYLLIKIDTEKLGIDNKYIIDTNTLFEKDLVRDAELTNESWIITSFSVETEDMQIICVTGWIEEEKDVIPHFIYEIAEDEYEGDYCEAYMEELNSDGFPVGTIINGVRYFSANVKKGDELEFQIGDELIPELIQEINDNNNLKLISEWKEFSDTIKVLVLKDCNIRNIIDFHLDYLDLI